jgi:hypothetical protein
MKLKKAFPALLVLALLSIGLIASDRFFFDSRLADRVRAHHLLRRELWSIGIVRGETPLDLSVPEKPILRARDITDTAARMVADPFAVQQDNVWHLFFEIDSVSTRQGEIGLSISSNTTDWVYQGIVLDEPFHLSYPFVFQWEDNWYMVPESRKAGVIRLYRAESFPTGWTAVTDLIRGDYQDPTPFRHDGRWWLFATTGQNENLHLFYAAQLTGPWEPHALNPVIAMDRRRARCGGRPQVIEGRLIRFAQDCLDRYGHRLLGFEITRLTPTDYAERPLAENPLLEPDGSGWNAHRMHHLDLHQTESGGWIGFTDGNKN